MPIKNFILKNIKNNHMYKIINKICSKCIRKKTLTLFIFNTCSETLPKVSRNDKNIISFNKIIHDDIK